MAHIICVSRYGFVVIVFPDKNMIRDWKWNNSISYWYDDLCSIADRKLCYNTDYDSRCHSTPLAIKLQTTNVKYADGFQYRLHHMIKPLQ
jgi:hypothetical protein